MFQKVKVAKYVLAHKNELDKISQLLFFEWNRIGKLDSDPNVSNRMQQIFLISMFRIWLTTSGMPKIIQKQVLGELISTL